MSEAAARLLHRTFRRVIRHRIILNRPKRSTGRVGALYHQTRGHPTSLTIRNNKKGLRPLKALIRIFRLASSRGQDKRTAMMDGLRGRVLLRDRSTTRASQTKRPGSPCLTLRHLPISYVLRSQLTLLSDHPAPREHSLYLFLLQPADSCSEILSTHSVPRPYF
jgi:hypothetical protein